MVARAMLAALGVAAVVLVPLAACGATPPACEGSAVLDARVVENPTTSAGAAVASWDVRVPACARLLVYEIVDAETGRPVPRDAVFPHTSRLERWERRDGVMRLHLFLRSDAACGKGCTRKPERWVRRVRAVVRWSSDTRGA